MQLQTGPKTSACSIREAKCNNAARLRQRPYSPDFPRINKHGSFGRITSHTKKRRLRLAHSGLFGELKSRITRGGYRELRSPAEICKLLDRRIVDQDRRCAICHEEFTDRLGTGGLGFAIRTDSELLCDYQKSSNHSALAASFRRKPCSHPRATRNRWQPVSISALSGRF